MELADVTFTIPGRPIGKQRRVGKGGRAYIPTKTSNYIERCELVGTKHRPASWPLRQWYRFGWTAVFPSHRVPDRDNLDKSLCDAFNEVFWFDDIRVRVGETKVLVDPDYDGDGFVICRIVAAEKSDFECTVRED